MRSGKAASAHRPPKDEPWVWLTRELVSSAAWRSRSINVVRLINFLMVEHMNHAGTENGNLIATYDQLAQWRLTRSRIQPSTVEADFLGLLRIVRGGRWAQSNRPSTYRLTFLPDRNGNPPTNEWKGKTIEAIEAWKQDRTQRYRALLVRPQKQIPDVNCDTTVVQLLTLRDGLQGSNK